MTLSFSIDIKPYMMHLPWNLFLEKTTWQGIKLIFFGLTMPLNGSNESQMTFVTSLIHI